MRGKIYILILASVLLYGCDIFKTRTPQEPDQSSTIYQPATSPSVLFSNFTTAFRELNDAEYYKCFFAGDSAVIYQFIPEPTSAARYPAVFSNWSADNERTFILGLKSYLEQLTKPDLQWESSNYELQTADSSVMLAQYTIDITANNSITTYRGTARLTFYLANEGIWKISRWQDMTYSKGDTSQTWSSLKGQVSY
ncbi:MAG TPA: hypothetical protein PKV40_01415 [Candidatus Kapabacteria bacterium]|nr:hypothetical protein [Candidatus Kapabacteria bacterium]